MQAQLGSPQSISLVFTAEGLKQIYEALTLQYKSSPSCRERQAEGNDLGMLRIDLHTHTQERLVQRLT